MATKTKDYVATLSSDYSTQNPISVSKKTALIVDGITNKDDVSNLKFSIVKKGTSSYLLVTNSDSSKGIKLSNYSSIKYVKTDIVSSKKYELTDIIANSLVDNTANVISSYNKKKLTATGTTNYNDKIDMSLSDYAPTGATNIKKNKGLTINGGNGNDEIKGTTYNDTITGGKGDNKFYYTGGNDTIKLTKDENLTIIDDTEWSGIKTDKNDLLFYYQNDEGKIVKSIRIKDFAKTNVVGANGSIKLNTAGTEHYYDLNMAQLLAYGKDDFKLDNKKKTATLTGSRLSEIITDDTTLNGYTKTINTGNGVNTVNVNSSGKVTVNGGNGVDNITIDGQGTHIVKTGAGENSVTITSSAQGKATITGGADKDLIQVFNNDSDTTINAGNGNNVVYIQGSTAKNTVTTGSGADTITLATNADGITSTVNAGNGANNITFQGKGNNTIISGKDNDTINVNTGTTNTIIKAGKGENTINIENNPYSSFGNITLTEEKVSATNIINFKYAIDTNYTLIESGNDLIIQNDSEYANGSKIKIQGYYLTRTSKTKYAEIELKINGTSKTVDELLTLTGKGMTIGGSGTITGTENADNILANDYDTTLKASNDKITAGKGNDTINAGRGKNTIKFNVGDGADIIQDGGGTDTLVFANGVAVTAKYVKNDLVISYGTQGDTITLKDYTTDHSVKNIQIGTAKAKSIETYLPEPEVLKVGNYNIIQGTDNADNIIGTTSSDKIFGGNGNDTLNGNNGNDYLYGGAGDDTITGGKGNDTLFGGSGSNKFYFNTGDGQDIFLEDGVDNTLIFNNISNLNNLTFSLSEYGMGNYSNYDLVIKYSSNDTVTIKNFLSQPDSSSGYVYDFSGYKIQTGANGTPQSLLGIVNSIDSIKKTITINDNYKSNPKSVSSGEAQLGNQLDNIITGRTASDGADTTKTQYIFGMDGNDTITANGSDVDAGSGDDIITYNTASTYVYGGSGNDILNAEGSSGYGGDGDDVFYGIGSMSGDRGDDKFYLQGSSNPTDETQSSKQFNVITGSGNDYVDATKVTSLYDGDTITITTGEGVNTLHLDGSKAVNIILGLAETYRDISTNNGIEYQKLIESNMYNYNFNIYYTAYEKDGDLIIVSNRGGEQAEEYDNSTFQTVKNDGIGAGVTIIKGYTDLSNEQKANIKITYLPSNPYVNKSFVYPYKEGGAIMETYTLPDFLANIVNNSNEIYTTLEDFSETQTYTTKWFNKIDNSTIANTTVTGTDDADYILGGTSAQTINAGAGNDVVYANDFGSHNSNGDYVESQKSTQTTINGEGGNDYIIGSTGVDVINGGTGRDYIHGGAGDDILIGGSIETFEGATSNALYKYDEIHGGNGDDTIYSVNENQSYQGGETYYKNFLYGEEGDDTIYANGYADQVYGGEGDDTIYSYAQKYHQDSWDRDTNLFGGLGDDKIYIKSTVGVYADGGEGNDLIDVSESTGNYNRLEGGSGNDTINGGSGSSEIVGGMGDDIIYGGDGDEEIYGGVMSQAQQAFESDTIHAGKGSDIIYAGGSSKIFGDEGSNTIYFGTGSYNEASNLYITGGTGDDTYIYHGYNGIDSIAASEGNDVIKFANFSSAKTEQFENDLAIKYTNTSNITNVLILKDYFLSQNSFNDFSIATYNSDDVSGTGTEYTVAAFINNYQ